MQERKLMELAEAAGNIAIVGHVRPDGDCVGCCVQLYHGAVSGENGRCISGDASGKIFLLKAV